MLSFIFNNMSLEKTNKDKNKKANNILESKLMELDLEYYKTKCGNSKHFEESFTVENVEKNIIVALGILFKQKAIVYSTPKKTEITEMYKLIDSIIYLKEDSG